jgi:hypothetical protein
VPNTLGGTLVWVAVALGFVSVVLLYWWLTRTEYAWTILGVFFYRKNPTKMCGFLKAFLAG